MNLSIERAVALLTPIFAALSAALTAWLGAHFPGLPKLNPADTTALLITGATAGAAAALKWLHGRQKFVSQAATVEAFVKSEVAKALASQPAGPALEDIDALIKANQDQIVAAIGSAVHAPASVEQIVDEILARLRQPAVTFQSAGAPLAVVPDPNAPAPPAA